MEILLAIVWYLSLLTPGNYYEQADIYNIAVDNTDAVNFVAENHLTDAIDYYDTYSPEDGGILLPAFWDPEPKDHSDPNHWAWDPFHTRDPRTGKDTSSTDDSSNESSGGTDDGGNG